MAGVGRIKRRVSSTTPTDSSDWHSSRASEVGIFHPHGNVGAAPDAWDLDFRVPGIEKGDDGLGRSEESSEATASRGVNRTSGDATPVTEGARIEKPEFLNRRRRREEKTNPQETSTFRHVPGGAWLNKVLSLLKGQAGPYKQGAGEERAGREEEVGKRGLKGEATVAK
ncbi:hypothetical protein NDU88_002781 [Pleurodeles waltl]|uniref:Uncharacterized protein n=1 Tax=Pleurodeles waltl TaxID=8319 RepID=A0AAV7RGC4_PLEWA|nr:hypothetical protein NDU88_002781 [Pleurodeles waltl]